LLIVIQQAFELKIEFHILLIMIKDKQWLITVNVAVLSLIRRAKAVAGVVAIVVDAPASLETQVVSLSTP
jgi:hypothetical protein